MPCLISVWTIVTLCLEHSEYSVTLVDKFLHSGSSYFGPFCLLAVASTVPGVGSLIVNIVQFLLSTPHSTSQSNTLAIVLYLNLPRFGVIFLMMYIVNIFCLHQEKIHLTVCKSLSAITSMSPLCPLGKTWLCSWTYDCSYWFCSLVP